MNLKLINQTSELKMWRSSVTGCSLTEGKGGRSDTQSRPTLSSTSQPTMTCLCMCVFAPVSRGARRNTWLFCCSRQKLIATIRLAMFLSHSHLHRFKSESLHQGRFHSPESTNLLKGKTSIVSLKQLNNVVKCSIYYATFMMKSLLHSFFFYLHLMISTFLMLQIFPFYLSEAVRIDG